MQRGGFASPVVNAESRNTIVIAAPDMGDGAQQSEELARLAAELLAAVAEATAGDPSFECK